MSIVLKSIAPQTTFEFKEGNGKHHCKEVFLFFPSTYASCPKFMRTDDVS
jgi:hypothetical protein